MVFQWRDGSRFRAKAQDVGERIEAIRESNGGGVTPHDVVNDARDPSSPLHRDFEWDDAKAAESFRVSTAREMIACVMVIYSDEIVGAPKEPVRAFASIAGPTGRTPAYTSTLDAMRSPAMRAEVLAQAKRELEGWRRRYRHYQELAAAVQQVSIALDQVA